MTENLIPSVFFTLFFVVDPLGLIPIFVIYLDPYDARERAKIVIKTTVVSIAVSLFFIFLGDVVLKFMGITSGAFLVAGGILLFLISMDMLFGRPSRTRMSDDDIDPDRPRDVSVFPLAIPLLCGPGNIAALLMFSSQVRGNPYGLTVIAVISVIVFLISMVVMFLSTSLNRVLGETVISVITRLIGLVLSALAIQFVGNGLKQMGII